MPSPSVERAAAPLARAGLARAVLLGGIVALAGTAGPAAAHGAFLDAAPVGAVAVQARYDSGEPMGGARITVFAPDDPARPWQVGTADAEGRYLFVPGDQPGRWAIQARLAGHGAMGYVTLGADAAGRVAVAAVAPARPDLAQRLLMVACVLWGCIGTALHFRHRRRAEVS